MKTRKPLALLLLASALVWSGCGVGQFTREPVYQPAVPPLKTYTSGGLGVLPIEDQRPSAGEDSSGGNGAILGCILIGGILPVIGAHVEHPETASDVIFNAYNPAMQRQQGSNLDPTLFLRQDLVKEFAHSNAFGPVEFSQRAGDAPLTLKAVLKSDRMDARTYCYTPMDTTWIWWFLGLPFTSYDFTLKMDLTLLGPDGTTPLWSQSVDEKVGGMTDFYYATGPTGENNLVKVYGDILAGAMAKAAPGLKDALEKVSPDLWQKTSAPPPQPIRERVRQAEPAAGAETEETPWWKK